MTIIQSIKMQKIFKKILYFSSSVPNQSYEKYLNSHIIKSLQNLTPTPNKLKSKETCQHYFIKIVNKYVSANENQLMIKNKLNMVFSAAFQLENFEEQRNTICKMIEKELIKNQSQLDRILKWLFKQVKFNNQLTEEQILKFIQQQDILLKEFFEKIPNELTNTNNDINFICKQYRQKYPYLDNKIIFEEVKKKITGDQNVKSINNAEQTVIEQNKFWDKIHKIKPRLIKQELNDPKIYEQHKAITQGRLRFRFPPEPNGYLHIGHVKSIRMNFQTAKRLDGECYLRYDDTNPDKQTHQFIEEIERNVKWLGYSPNKINFTSDYFEQMLHYANKLVKDGKAYVCESTQNQIQAERKEKKQNPFRNKTKEFSQKIFPYLQPHQTLRLKLDPEAANPTLRDPIIYRFKSASHPKTGLKYSIYPMYDFAHCISDSIQHIDYSLCSLQFQIRRELYYRILDMLGLYKPIVWQFSRLNISGNLISKRKIKQLIENKSIQGWDDPRLLTINGLQRRGYTPIILNNFIDKVNSSRNGNEKYVSHSLLERQMKKDFINKAKKIMVLRNPIKVKLNKPELKTQNVDNKQTNRYIKELSKSKEIYLQKQDYNKLIRQSDVVLKYGGIFRVNSQKQLEKSQKTVQQAKKSNQKIPILSWLSDNHFKKKVIMYEALVNENQQFNPESKKEIELHVEEQFQKLLQKNDDDIFLFQRIGYFKRDKKTKEIICCAEF